MTQAEEDTVEIPSEYSTLYGALKAEEKKSRRGYG